MRALFRDDANWTPPGDSMISGAVFGGDAVVERAKLIANYGLAFKPKHILRSLHNTAEQKGRRLNEKLATVCHLRDGRIAEVETFLSDAPGMNRCFVREP